MHNKKIKNPRALINSMTSCKNPGAKTRAIIAMDHDLWSVNTQIVDIGS